MESSSQTNARSGGSDRTLVVMAKAPKPGQVKTRLAECLPAAAVISLYRCLFDDTIALAKSLGNVEIAIMCPAPDVDDLAHLVGGGLSVIAQTGEGLAAGLTSVFAHFTATGQQRVIAFNSDSPHLPASVLESAFAALATCDVVIGPTYDGGYYLVGAKAAHPTLFENDRMGTTNALEGLLTRARRLKLSTSFTDRFYDIDVAGDLIRLARELQLAPERAPRTAAWCAQWGQLVAQFAPGIGDL